MITVARIALAAVGLMVAASSAYVLAVPVSADDFESATGTSWDAFSDASPNIAAYLEREARILGVGHLGFGLLASAASWLLGAAGGMGAAAALALIPLALGAVSVVFLTAGGVGLGAFYGALAIVAALAVVAVGRRAGR